jgi:maltokinase
MAQSFIHAGLVVAKHNPDLDRRAVIAAAEMARDSFLDSYRVGLGEHRGLLDDRLLVPFALRQVCREFSYAARHLPRWSYVPEGALPMLLAN